MLINDESDEDSDGNNIAIEDENVAIVGPFKPGYDKKNARNDFAQKQFNEKSASFADRSRRELPSELLQI